LVSKAKADEIRQMVESFNPKVRILNAVKGEIDIRLILDQDLYKTRQINHHGDANDEAHEHTDHSQHLHSKYSTFSWTSSQPLDPMKFQEFVNRKLETNVYRAKGIIDFGLKGHSRKYIFQLVGVRPELVWENWDTKPLSEIVFIGQDIDEKKLKIEIKACIDTTPDAPLSGNIELKLPKKADL
jgi:G3E family GTPase